jgi:hypothetical protein
MSSRKKRWFSANRSRLPLSVLLTMATIVLPACASHHRENAGIGASATTPDAIFTRYYNAIGGRDRLERIQSRHMWGVYSEGTLTANTDIAWKRPALRRVNVHAPGFDYSEGFDGRTWEYNFQTQRLVVDTGAAADAGRRGAEFDESFVDYARKRHQVSVLGAEPFDGRPAHRVRVVLEDGWAKEYVFDDSTGLILALRKAMPLHARGAPVTSVTTYEDWHSAGGVLQPYRFTEREVLSGKIMNTLKWDSIRVNLDLSARELGRPPDR